MNRYRDIRLAARGTLQRWNSNVGLELKWDVNRDPSQKLVISFTTRSSVYASRSEYNARFNFEYPGHISMASFIVQHQGRLFKTELQSGSKQANTIASYFLYNFT